MQMISHPEKILFPDDGITKGELASYYARVASVMLPHIRRRPVTMERYHRGIGAPGFFQKDVSKGFPEWLKRVDVPKNEGTVNHPLVTRYTIVAVAREPEQHHDSRVAFACAELLQPRHLRV